MYTYYKTLGCRFQLHYDCTVAELETLPYFIQQIIFLTGRRKQKMYTNPSENVEKIGNFETTCTINYAF